MSSLREDFNALPFQEVYKILSELNAAPELTDKLIVGGGIAPYLLIETNSERQHRDADLLVDEKDMTAVRDYLKKHHLYDARYDSLSYQGVTRDHGVTARINGFPVGFYPYNAVTDEATKEPAIDIYAYSFGETPDQIDLKESHIVGFQKSDLCITKCLSDDSRMKIISPEVVVVSKLGKGKNNLRDKDKQDLQAMVFTRMNAEKMKRIYHAFNHRGTRRSIAEKDVEKVSLDDILKIFRYNDLEIETTISQ